MASGAAKLICAKQQRGRRHGEPQVEGFHGSDLDVVTSFPPPFCGLEPSHVTMATREAGNEVQLGSGLVSGLYLAPAAFFLAPQQSHRDHVSQLSVLHLGLAAFKALYIC